MGCPARCFISETVTFSVTTHDPATGAASDADSLPTYRVYEDESAAAILTGTMAKLDDSNTLGLYSGQLAVTAANGFEDGKSYTIYISATVGGIVGCISYSFKAAYDLAKADFKIDTTQSPWELIVYQQGTTTEIMRKQLKDINGNGITSSSVVVGQHINV